MILGGLAATQGHDQRGNYEVAMLSVTIIGQVVAELGNAAISHTGARKDRLPGVVLEALGLAIVLGGMGTLAIMGLTVFGSEHSIVPLIAALALIPYVLTAAISHILLGVNGIRLWNYLHVLPQVIIFLTMLVAVVVLEGGARGAITAWAIGYTVTAIVAIAATSDLWLAPLRRHRDGGAALATAPAAPGGGAGGWFGRALSGLDPARTLKLLRFMVFAGVINVIALLNTRVELGFLRAQEHHAHRPPDAPDVGMTGVYAQVLHIGEALLIVSLSLASAACGPCVRANENDSARLVSRFWLRAILITTAAAAGLYILAPYILDLSVFGWRPFKPQYREGATPLRWLLPGIVAWGPVAILSTYIATRRGRGHYLALVGGAAVGVTTLLAWLLVPRGGVFGGMTGAAVASSTGYVVGSVTAWVLFVRLARLPWHGYAYQGLIPRHPPAARAGELGS